MALSTVLQQKIQTAFNNNEGTQFWDYNEQFSKENVISLLKGERDEVYEQISECVNNFSDTEWGHAKSVIEPFIGEICTEIEMDEDDFDFDDFWGEYREYFDVSIDDNIEQLARNTPKIRVRITLESNWDSLESCYDMRNEIEMDSYFGELITALQLCPQTVKKFFVSKGWTATGKFPSKPKWTPLVSIEDFWTEIENNNCYSKFVFYGRVSATDLWNLEGKPLKASIAKGETCGLYSASEGGGSVLEMNLLQNVTVDLDKKYTIVFDDDRDYGYGIDDAYGLTNEGWGKKNIEIC